MSGKSGIRGFMNNVVTARQRQADRFVNGVLLSMDDDTLKSAGYDRSELRRRSSATFPF
ncbi:MAG: hypothetical protein AAGH82_08970 [Pseudomonadota bacterium]